MAADPPVADRPHMPGYGIAPAGDGSELLPWQWAAQRLASSHSYWLATADPTGRPHLAAVWGLWNADAFWFSTGGRSRKARNLHGDPRCAVTTTDALESVVVEGTAHRVTDPDPIAALYRAKYDIDLLDPAENPVFVVRPDVAFGLIEAEFATRATRWRF